MLQVISKRQRQMEIRLAQARTKHSRSRSNFFRRRFTDYTGFYGEGVAVPSSIKDIDTTNNLIRKMYPKFANLAGYDVYNVKTLNTPEYNQYIRILTAAMGTSSLVDQGVLWFIKEGK